RLQRAGGAAPHRSDRHLAPSGALVPPRAHRASQGRRVSVITIEDLVVEIETAVGMTLQDHQRWAVNDAWRQAQEALPVRMCLYHRTGAGKTLTALAAVVVAGASKAL